MILAAGLGSRLRPLTDRRPKPLVEVGGHPLIAYPLALCRAAGIGEVVINLHHHGDAIRAALGDGRAFGVSIAYSPEDPLLDTGGGILRARPLLGEERFVVLNSDSIIDLDLRALVADHVARGAVATMVLRRDREQRRFGEIEIDAAHRVRRFLGQPATVDLPLTAYMFAGVHVLEPQVYGHMASGPFGIVKQTYPAMLAAGCAVSGYVYDGYWRVLDTHAGLAEGRYELSAGPNPLRPEHRPGGN